MAVGCAIPSKMIQLFFFILKSVIDYGSIIYTKIKAVTTTDKFAQLRKEAKKRIEKENVLGSDILKFILIGIRRICRKCRKKFKFKHTKSMC